MQAIAIISTFLHPLQWAMLVRCVCLDVCYRADACGLLDVFQFDSDHFTLPTFELLRFLKLLVLELLNGGSSQAAAMA